MSDDQKFFDALLVIEQHDPAAAWTLLSKALEFSITPRERLFARRLAAQLSAESSRQE